MPPAISLCMIVRNEEANLPNCLASVADLVQEIIVVDTGSTDRTRELAASFGARVVEFAWIDDFAAARNESLRHATGSWIFWLDADDRVDDDNRSRLRRLFASLTQDHAAYLMTYRALNDVFAGKDTQVERVALFRNHPQIRWQYRIHEQISPAVERVGDRIVQTDVVLHTIGLQNAADLRDKLERNYRLLLLENADRPGDPLTEWNLGRTALRTDRVLEAAGWLAKCLARREAIVSPQIQTLAYGQLAEALCRLGQFPDALAVCREGRVQYPQDIALLLAEGVVLARLGQLCEAEPRLIEVIRREPTNALAQTWLAWLQAQRSLP